MRIKDILNITIQEFKKAKIILPELDAEVLLAFTLKKPREYLYAHSEAVLTIGQQKTFQRLIAHRAKHEPIAYLTGHKEFFGLNFIVSRDVLIPRPETELLVDETLRLIEQNPSSPPLYEGKNSKNPSPNLSRVLPLSKGEKSPPPSLKGAGGILIDVGTGSGCIPIAIVKKSGIGAIAIDTSSAALKIARQNAKQNGVNKKINFLKGDLLKNSRFKIQDSRFLIITANLPYLPTAEWRGAMPDVKKYEPRLALDGGRDGLNYYRKLLPQIKSMTQISQIPIICLFEFCPEQKSTLKKLILKYFSNPSSAPAPSRSPSGRGRKNVVIETKKDLAGRDRLLILEIKN